MPALSAPQLALLRSQPHLSHWYCVPCPPQTIFAAMVNGSPGISAVVIPYDTVTVGAFGAVKQGMTVRVGSVAGASNYGILRIRLVADATNLYVSWNSDIAWADNLYLTVQEQYLPWQVRQRISPPTIYKDYNIAYTDQTEQWPPVAMMGDNVCKLWAGNPTTVYFDGSESYAVGAGATISSYAWAFDDGGTSTAMTPGNHNYTAAGTYYPTLTVTDSNGKTHLTRRIVSLPDPVSIYTVRFEGTSLEGAIDEGWNARVRVFDPDISTASFPERAPCFLISFDTYGITRGSVGFPVDREQVVMFGYIAEGSVAIRPEYNEVEFEIESIAGVMNRETSPPVFLLDSADPSAEDDAWAWGQNVNVFRGMVYLLKFHSTIMDIADVALYNDTTLTKAVDYPQDTLWNMLIQFAKGKRLMRGGVTRTGRIVVGRDPNLVPVASRTAFITVMQLAQGDWQEQITAPQMPYPRTSFLCLSGLTYDGIPANEPNPVFGMSPGRPPKDHGSERELQFLKLVDQTEANTLAGLLVGTDNMPYGEIVIPMRGNWSRAFDPAYQEYVQTPAAGFVTKRGTILVNELLIVRKVSVAYDWEAGTMNPTLTCDYYSYPEVSTNGDCWPPDAPPPPATVYPSIYAPPRPNPTGPTAAAFTGGVWTLFSTGDIYRLDSVGGAGGSATSKNAWKVAFFATRTPRDIAPSTFPQVNVMSTVVVGNVQVQHSVDEAVLYSSIAISPSFTRALMRRDPQDIDTLWVFVAKLPDPTLFTDQIGVLQTGFFNNTNVESGGLTDFKADTGDLVLYYSTNGGGSWNSVLLGYINQLWNTQLVGHQWLGVSDPYNEQSYNDQRAAGGGGTSAAAWNTLFSDPGGPFDATMGVAVVGADSLGVSPQDPLGYWIFNYAAVRAHTLSYTTPAGSSTMLWPTFDLRLAPDGSGVYTYAIVTGYEISSALQIQSFGSINVNLILNPAIPNPSLGIVPFQWPGDWNYQNMITMFYRVSTAGASTSRNIAQAEYSGIATKDTIKAATTDLTDIDFIYLLTNNSWFIRFSYPTIVITWTYANAAARLAATGFVAGDIGKYALQSDTNTIWELVAVTPVWEYVSGPPVDLSGVFSTTPTNIFITTQGTILIGCTNGHIWRSDDRGQTWTDKNLSATGTFGTFFATEYHGVVGGAVGVVIVPVDNTGKYVYSLDDGVVWSTSADLVVHSTVLSNFAR